MKMDKISTPQYDKHLNQSFSCLVQNKFDLNFEDIIYLFPKEDIKQSGQLIIRREAEASQSPDCN